MKKIPCLFERVFHDKGKFTLTKNITPGCEWCFTGEGIATRKWDGTAVLVKDNVCFARYDAKHGKPTPEGFIPAQDADPITGHYPGWIEVKDQPQFKYIKEAFNKSCAWANDTYEAVGPKINGNHENEPEHILIRHGHSLIPQNFLNYEQIEDFLSKVPIEGIVFHRAGRGLGVEMVKIRRKDFGFEWPIKERAL